MHPGDSSRVNQYKNKGKDTFQRSTRVDEAVNIRKDKREGLLSKRRNISIQDENVHSLLQMETEGNIHLARIVALAQSYAPEDKLAAIRQAYIMLSSDRSPPVDDIISSGILNILVDSLASDDTYLQFEAACAITNFASGTSEQTEAVVSAGAVPLLVNLLKSDSMNVCEQCVWALGNIIGDGPRYRDCCIEFGILPPLLSFIKLEISLPFLRNVAWVIGNICRYREPPPTPETVMAILPALMILLQHEDSNVLVDTVWALSYLTDGANERIQLVVDSGIVAQLVPMLGHTDLKVQTAALRAVGNIVTGSDELTQVVIDCGALEEMPQFLLHKEDKIKKEAAWLLSNVTAGNQVQVQAILDADLMPLIIKILNDADFSTQKEAAWTVSNLTLSGSPDQVEQMVNCGVIPPFCALLDCKDPQIVQVVLSGIYNILRMAGSEVESICDEIEECGGLEKIERFQDHENQDICKLTYEIVETYFSLNSENEIIGGHNGFVQLPWKGWSLS